MKKPIIFLVVSFLCFGSISTIAAPAGLDGIVAVVNDNAITASQLNDRVRLTIKQMQAAHAPVPSQDVLRKKVLDQMIDNELQIQAGKKEAFKLMMPW